MLPWIRLCNDLGFFGQDPEISFLSKRRLPSRARQIHSKKFQQQIYFFTLFLQSQCSLTLLGESYASHQHEIVWALVFPFKGCTVVWAQSEEQPKHSTYYTVRYRSTSDVALTGINTLKHRDYIPAGSTCRQEGPSEEPWGLELGVGEASAAERNAPSSL